MVVVTSDRMGAGTDANVFIDIHGMDGSNTGRTLLNNKGNDFERGQTDTFTVSDGPRRCRSPGTVSLVQNLRRPSCASPDGPFSVYLLPTVVALVQRLAQEPFSPPQLPSPYPTPPVQPAHTHPSYPPP